MLFFQTQVAFYSAGLLWNLSFKGGTNVCLTKTSDEACLHLGKVEFSKYPRFFFYPEKL